MQLPRFTLDELLSYHGERFVQCAHYTLLGRKPDARELQQALAQLGSGTSRLAFIDALRSGDGAGAGSLQLDELAELLAQEAASGQPDFQPIAVPPWFDPVWYFEEYPDVAQGHLPPYGHYLRHGSREGRCPAFDPVWYLQEYRDVPATGLSAREHYDTVGRRAGLSPWFDAESYRRRYPDVATSGLTPREHYDRFGRREGRVPAEGGPAGRSEYLRWIAAFGTLSGSDSRAFRARSETFAVRPLISVILPVYDPAPGWLVAAIESVRTQIYPGWELCIADDASTCAEVRAILGDYAARDPRIRVVYRERNGHICAASNSALGLAQGEWLAFLDHDDLLAHDALYRVVEAINGVPDARILYSDEDKLDATGVRYDPYFKCDWNEELFHFHNMISHLGVYHRALVADAGGFREGFEGSQDYDLALRCIERVRRDQIVHIPRILYHWRAHARSTASGTDAKPYAEAAGIRALQEHFDRGGIAARVGAGKKGHAVSFALPEPRPLVSLIVAACSDLPTLRRCVDSIVRRTAYDPFELIVIAAGDEDPATGSFLQELALEPGVRVLREPAPGHAAAMTNAAARLAAGEILGLISGHLEVVEPGWLTELVRHAVRPAVGAVGAGLWSASDTLLYGGLILGQGSIVAAAHRGLARGEPGYMSRALAAQQYSAVSGACMLVRRSVYAEVGGLNESDLQGAFSDVDLCLRIRAAGFRNIWTPQALVRLHEVASPVPVADRGKAFQDDADYMMRRWPAELAYDPAFSPNLAIVAEDFGLAWPPRVEWLGSRYETGGEGVDQSKKTVLVIGGMHRSGTSTIAAAISRLGATLPRNLLPPQPDNPRGFFESSLIVELNDRILQESGTAWWDWRQVDNDWKHNPKGARLVAEARALVADEFGDADFIVLKDPRLPKLMPFWQQVLESSGYRLLHVVPVRHPNEVAASLHRREGRSLQMARLTWLRHVVDAEVHTRGQPRAFMLWHQFVADWEKSLVTVAATLGFRWPRLSDAVRAEVAALVSTDLIHHRESHDDPDACPDCSGDVASAYAAMIQLAADPDSSAAMRMLDTVRSDFLTAERVCGPYFAELELTRQGLENRRDELLAQLHARDESIARLHGELEAERSAHDASRRILAGVQVDLELARSHAISLAEENRASQAAHVAELSASQARFDAQLQEATVLLDAGRQERESLQEALRGAEAGQGLLAGQLEATRHQLAELHRDHSLLAATIVDLQEQLSRLRDKAQSATERLRAYNEKTRWQKLGAAIRGAGA